MSFTLKATYKFAILTTTIATTFLISWFWEQHETSHSSIDSDYGEVEAEKAGNDSFQDSDRTMDQPTERLGISRQKPAAEFCVDLGDGTYMVSYTTKIPGTDIEYTMVPIPGGRFSMGSPESEPDRNEDEGPQVEVIVEPFWMGKYEVTWAEYKKYMQMDDLFLRLHQAGMRNPVDVNAPDVITAPSSLYDPSFTYADGGEPDQPAATISQFAAKQYTKWLSLMSGHFYRLPYEAEWEYACRAGTDTAYYFGDDPDELDEHAWYVENCDQRQAVGLKKPNPWGLYDMYGNVAEWVLDQYDEEGYTHITEDSVTVEQSFRKPTEVYPRVVRGGHYLSFEEECRSASRMASENAWRDADPNRPQSPWWYTDEPATGVGFRLLRPLKQIEREQMESFWNADVERIMYEAQDRIESNGRGRFGTVDLNLPKDIQQFLKDQ